MKLLAGVLFVAAALAVETTASADPTVDQNAPGVLKLHVFDIYGHDMRPHVVTTVSKLPMQQTLNELRQPFLTRIEQATKSDPF